MKKVLQKIDEVTTLISKNKPMAAAIALALTSITGVVFSEEIILATSVVISSIL